MVKIGTIFRFACGASLFVAGAVTFAAFGDRMRSIFGTSHKVNVRLQEPVRKCSEPVSSGPIIFFILAAGSGSADGAKTVSPGSGSADGAKAASLTAEGGQGDTGPSPYVGLIP
ncbi:OLC1v1007066C1 [Oldenlandia corymbosa var. corymbosa]|uniref:OLC1v1007066C1 n=1 Tax=Oldenlandia corymbosa var. corymbosa TaxID=529605 RepID=A0AAV1DJ34_OLDCO|nr:OLC1v1007066C1 [Oldenlandia corymbosa var. corymbosa]